MLLVELNIIFTVGGYIFVCTKLAFFRQRPNFFEVTDKIVNSVIIAENIEYSEYFYGKF